MRIYNYSFTFKNVNEIQFSYITNLFDDFSWSHGFAVLEREVSKNMNDLVINFKSSKNTMSMDGYIHAGEKDTLLKRLFKEDSDLNNNFIASVLGKEQFLSNLYFQNIGIENCDCYFTNNYGKIYKMEISKYGGLELME
jgi:hypothetical protein